MAFNSRTVANSYLQFLKDTFVKLDNVDRRGFWRFLGRCDPTLVNALFEGATSEEKFLEAAFEGE